MIEFSGCGQENKFILNDTKSELNEFLTIVASNKQLRSEITETLEKKLTNFGQSSEALSRVVGSATDGLFFSLLSSELKPGSRIGVTAYSFHASASCILRAGFKPVFIDVDDYGLIDLDSLENVAENIEGLIIVQLFGNTVNEEKVLSICKRFNIKFIEDAAQRHTFSKKLLKSNLCISSVLSFDPNKIFSGIGSGGAIITKSENVQKKITSLRYHGNGCIEKGFNSQLSESSAWLILKKIEKFNIWDEKRRNISIDYNKVVSNYKTKLRSLVDQSNMKDHSLHKYVLVFNNEEDRNYIEAKLSEDEIKTMVHYRYVLPELPRFIKINKSKKFPKSNFLSRHSLSLPMHAFIKDDEILKITNRLSFHLGNL